MQLTKKSAIGAGVLSLAGLALAHHVPVALSYVEGENVLKEITVYLNGGIAGVPPTVLSLTETSHHISGLAHGESFQIQDHSGAVQTVVFDQADFTNIHHASDHEIVDAINAQITIAQASAQNGHFVFEGRLGGGEATDLTLIDGAGSPLQDLSVVGSDGHRRTRVGFDDVTLTLSAPAGEPLEGQPYILFASDVAGDWHRDGHVIPVLPTATMRDFYNATLDGRLSTFVGQLDDNADGTAVLPLDTLRDLLGPNPPAEIHLAYVVLTPDGSSIDFVSNQFTIHIVN